MCITYDPNKRAKTLASRGLDFDDAVDVLAARTFEVRKPARVQHEESQ